MKFVFIRFEKLADAQPVYAWLRQLDKTQGNVFLIQEGEKADVAFPLQSLGLEQAEVRPYFIKLLKLFKRILRFQKLETSFRISIGSFGILAIFVKPSPLPGLIALKEYWLRDKKINHAEQASG